MAGILDLLSPSGDTGSAYAGILSPAALDDAKQQGLMALAAGLLGQGPSRLPLPAFGGLGAGMAAFDAAQNQATDRALKAALAGPQIQGLSLKNQLDALNLAGFQRYQSARGPAPATAAGANVGAMTPPSSAGPSPGILVPPGFTPDTSAGIMAPTAGDTAPAASAPPTISAPSTVAPSAPGSPTPATPARAVGAPPPPLFDVGSLAEQYKILAGFPAGAALAAQLLQEINKGVPEGAYLGTDGKLYARGGYIPFKQNVATAETMGKNLQTMDGQGNIVNLPGAVRANSQMAGGVAQAQAEGALPSKVTEIRTQAEETRRNQENQAGFEMMPVKVPMLDANGHPTGAYRTLQLPKSYLPRLVASGTTPEGEPFYPPNVAETMRQDAEWVGKTLLPAKEAAMEGQGHAQTLFNSLEQMRQSKLTQPGMFAGATIGAANVINDLIGRLGGQRFDENELAGADAFQKSSVRLAADMTRMLGSREAAQIFMKIANANPNWYMQPASNLLVTNLINQAFQRSIDKYGVGYGAAAKGQLAQSAVTEFDQLHPETEYVQKAFKLAGMDQAWMSKPVPAERDINKLAMAPEKYAADFDAKFGQGRAAFVLGQRGAQTTGAPAPNFSFSATNPDSKAQIFSNDGRAWFNADGSPYQPKP